jgi:protocatechuate 3,4-dioxygenase beta subunit
MKIQPYKQRDWKSHPPYTFEAYGSSVKRGPLQKLIPINQTLSEITGPLFNDSEFADRDLASQCRRALSSSGGSAQCAARSELYWRRTEHDQ